MRGYSPAVVGTGDAAEEIAAAIQAAGIPVARSDGDSFDGLGDVETAWLRTSLAITMRSGAQPLLLVDPIHPVAEPTSAVAPCTRHELKRRIQAVAGAVILQCEGRSTRIVGLVP